MLDQASLLSLIAVLPPLDALKQLTGSRRSATLSLVGRQRWQAAHL